MSSSMHPHTLASDNFSGIHPEVLTAIQNANVGHAMAYGGDHWTLKAEEIFKKVFGPSAEAFIVCNGTGANVCALKHTLSSWQGVLCPESAHILTSECGAPSAITGCSLLPVPTLDGKLRPEMLSSYLLARGDQHHVQPKAIFISQTTELGTLYSLEELHQLGKYARQNDLLFLMDGARLSNAAAALNTSLKAVSTEVGVDVLSFGGTKNGLMGAEAVVFLKPGLSENFQYVRKQQLHLVSKMRFLSAQMIALLEGDLWKRNAHHANSMAQLLETNLRKYCPELQILHPVQSNALFVKIPSHIIKKLQEKSFFWIWDQEESIARWMTSWDTEPAFIEEFTTDLRELLG